MKTISIGTSQQKNLLEKKTRKIQAINTFKCGTGRVPNVNFTFKGRIKNFKLEGPGKLLIYEKSDEKYQT